MYDNYIFGYDKFIFNQEKDVLERLSTLFANYRNGF